MVSRSCSIKFFTRSFFTPISLKAVSEWLDLPENLIQEELLKSERRMEKIHGHSVMKLAREAILNYVLSTQAYWEMRCID